MADKGITEDYSCGYCWSKIDLMIDPRELPCKHVFCITCLQGDYSDNGSVTCPVCHEVYASVAFEELSIPLIDVKVANTPTMKLTCDVQECEGQLAVIHCVECGDNLCLSHQQNHKSLFSKRHMEVAIQVYEQSPETFSKPICEQHQEILVRACQRCDKLVCLECDIDEENCTGNIRHKFKSVKSLEEESNSYLKSQLNSAEQKLKEMVILDKDVRRSLDVEKEECEKRVKEIECDRDEQIRAIQEESEKLIKRVCDHQDKITDQVETFYNKLMVKKEQLEKVKLGIHRLLSEGHVTEKIRQKQRIAEELNKHIDEQLDDCQLTRIPALIPRLSTQVQQIGATIKASIKDTETTTNVKATLTAEEGTVDEVSWIEINKNWLIYVGSAVLVVLLIGVVIYFCVQAESMDHAQSKLSLRVVEIPSSLEFISEHDTNDWCRLANHRQDGDILICTHSGIHLLTRNDKKLTKYITFDKRVTSVIEYHKNIYILHIVGSTSKVEMCLPDDITKRQELFRFERIGIAATAMAVSNRFIVVANPLPNQLIIYNFITKQTNTVLPAVYPYDLHFLPDGHLLGIGGSKLIKYRIENGELSTIWTCEGLVDGYSVCADSDGLIYVSTHTKQTVYIISVDGVTLQELTHDKLPPTAGFISVKDGVLAVPGWGDMKLHLFKINRRVNTEEL